MKRNPCVINVDGHYNSLDLPRVDGGWKTILADPPWPYRQKLNGPKTRGGAEKHYRTMTIEDICALPVRQVAADDCQVWLWTTNTHLHHAFHVLEAWDVQYRVIATWVKNRMGLGYWLRGKTEHLLFGTIGNPRSKMQGPHGATGLNLTTLIEGEDTALITAKVGRHSEKPQVSYDMIEALSEKPRLELFARQPRKGWNVWGNEV